MRIVQEVSCYEIPTRTKTRDKPNRAFDAAEQAQGGGFARPPDLPSGNSDGTLPDKPNGKGGGRDGDPTGSTLSTSALILSAASALVLILGLLAALLYKRRK